MRRDLYIQDELDFENLSDDWSEQEEIVSQVLGEIKRDKVDLEDQYDAELIRDKD